MQTVFRSITLGVITFITPLSVLAIPQSTAMNISSCVDLQNINNDLTGNYVLVANVSCEGVNFLPIGSASTPFKGTLDGAGFTIKDLSISSSGSNTGLFAATSIASIKNLTLSNPKIHGSTYVGALVGQALRTTIDNVQIKNGLVTALPYSGHYVGGMVGLLNNSSSINNSSSSALVQGGRYVSRDVGGLVGAITNSNVNNSYATGIVQGAGTVIGGLVGGLYGESGFYPSVKNCYATGSVADDSGNNTRDMGGLIGYVNHGKVYNSFATGAITGANGAYFLGGLLGEIIEGEIQDSYATGAINGGARGIGGLVGSVQNSSIIRTYASGHITTNGIQEVGGLIGYNNNRIKVSGSYWDIQTTGQSVSVGGNGMTTANMYKQAIYSGWDFAKIWGIREGESYPFLLNSNSG